jgi:tetratricopeptide (TPR) repeat protein
MATSNRFQIAFGLAFWLALASAAVLGRFSCAERYSRAPRVTSTVQIRSTPASTYARSESQASRLYRAGNFSQAVQLQKEAAAQRPDDARIAYNLACYLCLAGESEESLEALAHAIEMSGKYASTSLDDDDFEALRGHPRFVLLTHVESARRSFAARHYRSAFESYRKVFTTLPKEELDAELLFEMSRAAVAHKQLDEALLWLDLALEEDVELARAAIKDAHFNDLKCDERFYAMVSRAFLPGPESPADGTTVGKGKDATARDPNSF